MNSREAQNGGKQRRLRLRRQTLRRMTDGELGAVVGGGDNAAPEPKSNAWTGGNDDGGRDYSCTQGG